MPAINAGEQRTGCNNDLQPSSPVRNSGSKREHHHQQQLTNNNNNSNIHKDDATIEKQRRGNNNTTTKQQHQRANKPIVARALSTLNRKRRRLRTRLTGNNSSRSTNKHNGGAIEHSGSSQNSVGTFELFKYADRREQVAVGVGIMCMWYAASWQPISVFILATMASLMGQYAKKVNWLWQLDDPDGTLNNQSSSTTHLSVSTSLFSNSNSSSSSSNYSLHDQINQQQQVTSANHFKPEDELPILLPGLYSLVTPLFDIANSDNLNGKRNESENIEAAIHDIEHHESMQFLRQSFAINGSAFLLALTQLSAFFAGITLITWAAKKQASRVKILYFRSCLHQEVTWFEAIDSASGSGSSLNALVEKYEDGIGMKLALLCYFIGHVGLFALIAFYQMFNLAAFCMPFVLLVGLLIAYLSEWQAVAIGEHALFAKRSLQLAEEIMAAIRTVFAFNGQQKEITRYSISLQPVYRKSLVKHLYTALNTSLSKFSIFACFACYCFYAMRFFPPYQSGTYLNKAIVLAVMRGAEVSIVNILISIPFMEALQQSKGSIARIYAAIERRSKINPEAETGLRVKKFSPSLSFKMVQFGYAQRSGPTTGRRRSTLPLLNLPGSPGSHSALSVQQCNTTQLISHHHQQQTVSGEPNVGRRRQSLIDDLADELEIQRAARSHSPTNVSESHTTGNEGSNGGCGGGANDTVGGISGGALSSGRRGSNALKRMIGGELDKPNKRILNYFNLEVKAGQSVALVGPSGSGKSTVLALVQRLYDVTGGQLLIGGHNVRELSVGWLRNQIGVVTQEPRLFDMSIADNIKLGLPANKERHEKNAEGELSTNSSSSLVMQQVVEAARAAGAHEFITRLPSGYATRVGSAGVQLSGGQKQRIAIARALIRKPRILLLDESTSALDTESEMQVQRALQLASEGRTTLTVAHRLATIKHAHLIVVMYQGQVVEQGSHEELMAQKEGIYRRMYEDQQAALETSPKPPPPPQPANIPELLVPEQLDNKEVTTNNSEKRHPLSLQFEREGSVDSDREEEDDDDDDDDDDDWTTDSDCSDDNHYDDDFNSSETTSSSGSSRSGTNRPSAWQLWQFVEMPRWSSLAAALVCLLAGLILPMNLIAHSYLFRAFAFDELDQIGDYLHVFGLLVLSFSTFVFIVSFLQVILPGYVGEKLSSRLRVKTMDALLAKPMFYFDMEANSAGAICDRLNSYVSNIQSIAGTRVATVLEAAGTLSAAAFFGFAQSLRLSLFCLSFALLVLLTTIIESRIMQRESNLQQRYDARLAHLMADALSNIKTIASLNQERFFIDRFTDIIRQREVGVGRCVGWLRTFLTSVKFVMPAMSWSASMYYACHLLVEGRVDVQTIFVVCPVVLFAVNDTFRALVFLPELLKARKSLERLFRMNREFSPQVLQTLTFGQQLEQQNQLHLEQLAAATLLQAEQQQHLTALRAPSIVEPRPSDVNGLGQLRDEACAKPKKSISFVVEPEVFVDPNSSDSTQTADHLPNRRLSNINALPSYMRRKSSRLNSLIPRQPARGRIEFRDVEFAYPNRPSALILDGFSLSVAPGESVALVGGSGSGKSTCVAVLEKFYDYHGGRVTLDGRDLRLVESHWTRSQIGLVSQEPTLLSYTIGDNIRYGDNSRFVSMDEVVEAARTANIHDFIMSLPDQYDTELSTSAYSSSQLSGGQRQRIAIARALIRNAPILIFDEATSALDSRNESVVQDALNKARKGRTSLTIAHRLATIKEADKIAVLDRGRVVEMGRHEELLNKVDGHYRRLWATQEGAMCT